MLDEKLLRAVDLIHLMAHDECSVTPCQHSSIGESDGRIHIPGTMPCPTLHLAAPCPPRDSPARAASLLARPLPSLPPPAPSPLPSRPPALHSAPTCATHGGCRTDGVAGLEP